MNEPDRKHEENLQNFKKVGEALQMHFEEDKINFKAIHESLENILAHEKNTKEFMENMSGLSDLVRGASLLKKPALWFLGLVLGLVALFGGLKAIGAWLIAQATR